MEHARLIRPEVPRCTMEGVARELLMRLGAYWRRRRHWNYLDADLRPVGLTFSGRFLADLALGELACHVVEGEECGEARFDSLVEAIANRQDASGAFRWNLYDPGATDPRGVRDQVDLAMVVDALSSMLRVGCLSESGSSLARGVILKAAAYLVTARWPGRPGIIRKRHYDQLNPLRWDVLNGDALAARAFSLAAAFPDGERYAERVEPFLEHLRERFGGSHSGWWSYAEDPETGVTVPEGGPVPTLFFQSIMVVHLRPICCQPLWRAYMPMVEAATDAIANGIDRQGKVVMEYESRLECRATPNAVVADALRIRYPSLAVARLAQIASQQVNADGEVFDLEGQALEDKWRIWLFADVARLLLSINQEGRR